MRERLTGPVDGLSGPLELGRVDEAGSAGRGRRVSDADEISALSRAFGQTDHRLGEVFDTSSERFQLTRFDGVRDAGHGASQRFALFHYRVQTLEVANGVGLMI